MLCIYYLLLEILQFQNPQPSTPYSKTPDKNKDVSVKLSSDQSNKNTLYSINSTNLIYVTINNNSDSTIYIYENWNSYGYYNFTFEIETEDSIYTLRRKDKLWYRNFPSFYSIKTNDSLTLEFMLIDTTKNILDENGWLGFPEKYFKKAALSVKYHLDEKYSILPVRDVNSIEYSNYIELILSDTSSINTNKDSSTIKIPYIYQEMFSDIIISEPINIQFNKDEDSK